MKKDIFITRGNIEILNQRKVALFSSKNTPPQMHDIIIAIFDKLRLMDVALAGGWQAPVEKKLFKRIMPDDHANYIYYLAKDINRTAPGTREEEMLANKKLIYIAPNLKGNRITGAYVTKRDELLLAQNNRILFLHIAQGGRLESYFRQMDFQKYQIFILDHPLNNHFFLDNVTAVNEDNLEALIGY